VAICLRKAILLLAILAFAVWLVAVSPSVRKVEAANVSIDVYAFEYFFTTSIGGAHNPTLVFTEGDVVTLTLHHEGGLSFTHGWEIVASYPSDLTVLFGAQTSLIGSGSQTTVVFTVGSPGAYDYICPVAGHASLGMLGQVTVNIIPEYPVAWVLGLFMVSMLLLAAGYKRRLFGVKSTTAQ
jgi:plastocyanin